MEEVAESCPSWELKCLVASQTRQDLPGVASLPGMGHGGQLLSKSSDKPGVSMQATEDLGDHVPMARQRSATDRRGLLFCY